MPDAPLINLTALLVEKDEVNAGVVTQIRNALAESPVQFKNLGDAADKLDAQLAQGKGDVGKTTLKLGLASFFLGRMDRAADLLKTGKVAVAQFYQGQALIELGRHDEALKALEGATKAGYAASEVELHKAAALRGMHKFDAALATLNAVEPYVKKTAEYLFQYGCVRLAQHDVLGAVDCFEKAVRSNERHAGVLFQLAFHNDRHGNDEEAMALYERSLQVPPARLGALMNLGVLYEDHGRHDRAVAVYDQVLTFFPNHARAKLFLLDASASAEQHVEEEVETTHLPLVHDALLDQPVTDFELSVRARNCLKRMNIRSIGDLTRCTEQQLLTSKNFGDTSLTEIKNLLTMKGLRLGQSLESQARRTHPAFNADEFSATEQAMFARPVGELNLSVRARKCLTRLSIASIGDLDQHSGDEMLECKNFGVTSLVEIRNKLREHNLKLRGD